MGFFTGDGHVSKDGKYINVEINEEDSLELRDAFSFTDWRIYKRERKNYKPQCNHRINNKDLNSLLTKLDFRKKSLKLPNVSFIPGDMVHYFIRGLFDADGYISLRGNNGICGIYSSFEYDWSDLIHILPDNISFDIRLSDRIAKNGKPHRYSALNMYNTEDVLMFCEYIYKGFEEDQIGLTRKYERFQYLDYIC